MTDSTALIAKKLAASFFCLAVFSVLGFTAKVKFGVSPGLIEPITGAAMLLCGAGAIALSLRDWKVCIAVAGLGAVAEIVGLYTGLPFGRYEYTSAWFPVLPLTGGHVFPVLLPVAWLLVAGGAHLVARRICPSSWVAFGGAALAAAIDLPMERQMTEVFGYWKWLPPGPLFGAQSLNFLGWFLVSYIANLALLRTRSGRSPSALPALVLGAFCAFTGACGVVYALDISSVGLLLLGIAIACAPKLTSARDVP